MCTRIYKPNCLYSTSNPIFSQCHSHALYVCEAARLKHPLGLLFQFLGVGKDIGDVEFDAAGEFVDSDGTILFILKLFRLVERLQIESETVKFLAIFILQIAKNCEYNEIN